MAAPSHGNVRCVLCAQQVTVALKDLTIDDKCGVYRVRCPRCKDLIVVDLTVELRHRLREAMVMTVEEHLAIARTVLQDDRDIWAAMLLDDR